MAAKRRRGERVSRHIPFGHRLNAAGRLEPDAREQEIIADMQALRGRGWSLQQIAVELNARGVATKQGDTAWSKQVVAKILKRTA